MRSKFKTSGANVNPVYVLKKMINSSKILMGKKTYSYSMYDPIRNA